MIYIILYNKSMDIWRSHERKERCRQSRVRKGEEKRNEGVGGKYIVGGRNQGAWRLQAKVEVDEDGSGDN